MEPLQQTEGDVNISPKRTKWQEKHIDAEARVLLKEDARYF